MWSPFVFKAHFIGRARLSAARPREPALVHGIAERYVALYGHVAKGKRRVPGCRAICAGEYKLFKAGELRGSGKTAI